MNAEGLIEEGFNLADGERLIRIDITRARPAGMSMVYGQTELTRDLIAARAGARAGDRVRGEGRRRCTMSTATRLTSPSRRTARRSASTADFIAGCDGFHGPSRKAFPAIVPRANFEREYPFGWLGVLADVPPCHHELIYSNGPRGFALASMRSATRSRYYIQVPLTDKVEDWPRSGCGTSWRRASIRSRAAACTRGPALEISIAPLALLCVRADAPWAPVPGGDSAHIVPPTGAKGLNLAASDVAYLSDALIAH